MNYIWELTAHKCHDFDCICWGDWGNGWLSIYTRIFFYTLIDSMKILTELVYLHIRNSLFHVCYQLTGAGRRLSLMKDSIRRTFFLVFILGVWATVVALWPVVAIWGAWHGRRRCHFRGKKLMLDFEFRLATWTSSEMNVKNGCRVL